MDPAPGRGFSFGNWGLDWQCGERGRLVKIPGQWPYNHSDFFFFIIIKSDALFLRQKDVHLVQLLKEGNFLHIHSTEGQTLLHLGKTGDVGVVLWEKMGKVPFSLLSPQQKFTGSVTLPRKQQGFLLPENKITLAKPRKGKIVPQPVRDIPNQIHTVGTTTCFKTNSWTEPSPAWATCLVGRAPEVVVPQESGRVGRDLS